MRLSPSLLRPGVAHLFVAHPDSLLAAAPGHAGWLSAPEREHAERYRRLGDAMGYRATRVLVRGVLAGLLGKRAAELDFVEGAHGRPALRAGTGELDFNASRSRAWVALVVTAGAPCGVDVEDVSRNADVLGIGRAFAPSERSLLEVAQGEERRRQFFALWTLKEATLKALGDGPHALPIGVRFPARARPASPRHLRGRAGRGRDEVVLRPVRSGPGPPARGGRARCRTTGIRSPR